MIFVFPQNLAKHNCQPSAPTAIARTPTAKQTVRCRRITCPPLNTNYSGDQFFIASSSIRNLGQLVSHRHLLSSVIRRSVVTYTPF